MIHADTDVTHGIQVGQSFWLTPQCIFSSIHRSWTQKESIGRLHRWPFMSVGRSRFVSCWPFWSSLASLWTSSWWLYIYWIYSYGHIKKKDYSAIFVEINREKTLIRPRNIKNLQWKLYKLRSKDIVKLTLLFQIVIYLLISYFIAQVYMWKYRNCYLCLFTNIFQLEKCILIIRMFEKLYFNSMCMLHKMNIWMSFI